VRERPRFCKLAREGGDPTSAACEAKAINVSALHEGNHYVYYRLYSKEVVLHDTSDTKDSIYTRSSLAHYFRAVSMKLSGYKPGAWSPLNEMSARVNTRSLIKALIFLVQVCLLN
jgi:hypothetical protein